MVNSGSASRYLIYATGEVLLVMVGILLALQVNNWNEGRKANEFEKNLLLELNNSIEADYLWIEFILLGNDQSRQSNQIILTHLEKDIPYHDSLNQHFANANFWWFLTLRKDAYENAKEYGLHFISNDSTRSLLAHIYENRLPFMDRLDERQSLYYYTTIEPLMTNLFESTTTNNIFGDIPQTYEMIPINYDNLDNEPQFKTILKTNVGNRNKFEYFVNWVLSDLKEVHKRIKSELKVM